MPLDPAYAKAMLDWVLGGATPTAPTARFVSLATATPTTQSTFDCSCTIVGAGPGFSNRASLSMAAANSPQGSVTNVGSAGSWAAAVGVSPLAFNAWDASSGGTRMFFGTFTSSATGSAGQTYRISIGAFKVILS